MQEWDGQMGLFEENPTREVASDRKVVVFDVETVFLFPWAVMFDKLALFGFIEMMIFLGILVIGYIFVWNRGALDWA